MAKIERTSAGVSVNETLLIRRKVETTLRRSHMLENSVDRHGSGVERIRLRLVNMLALQRHEAKVRGVVADENYAFENARRGLNATRSRDDGAIALQEELTTFRLCWYQYAFQFAKGLQRVSTCGRVPYGSAGEAIGDALISDDAKNACAP